MADVRADAIAALEAELDAANLRAQDLAARLDRARTERDHQAACARYANEAATAHATDFVAMRRDRDKAIAILHLVYEMREHAIETCGARCIIDNLFGDDRHEHETCRKFFDACATRDTAIETQRRLNRRTQIAESYAADVARANAVLTARLDGALREMTAERLRVWAEIEREHGCGRRWAACASEALEAYAEWMEGQPSLMSRDGTTKLMREHAQGLRAHGRSAMGRVFGTGDTIPPVALEASDGGNRQMEAAEKDVRIERAERLRDRTEVCRWCQGTKQSRNPWSIICAECRGTGRQAVFDLARLAGEKDSQCGRCDGCGCIHCTGPIQRDTIAVEVTLPETPRDEDWWSTVRDNARAIGNPDAATLDAIASALHCDRSDVAEAVTMLVAAHEVAKRERDATDTAMGRSSISDMDEAELRAVISSQSTAIYDLRMELEEARANDATAMIAATEAIARAERAEAVIAKVRAMRERYIGGPRDLWAFHEDALAILDGKEGA